MKISYEYYYNMTLMKKYWIGFANKLLETIGKLFIQKFLPLKIIRKLFTFNSFQQFFS